LRAQHFFGGAGETLLVGYRQEYFQRVEFHGYNVYIEPL
jgi:hypothetical protein